MAEDIQILHPSRIRNRLHHLAGLGILAANFVRHRVRGYRNPRPHPLLEPQAAYRYDHAVVESWLHHLRRYTSTDLQLDGKVALEIGPGPDLGTGLILLAMGLDGYRGVDVHPLVERTSTQFHEELARTVAAETGTDAEGFMAELLATTERNGQRLQYICQPSLDLSVLGENSVDFVLSHAAFEHLDHVEATVKQMTHVARPGAILISEVDLQTHTRWIRDADPLNIYRYSEGLYRALWFSGAPNRVRPDEYVEALVDHGWHNPRFYPRRVLEPDYVRRVEPSLAPPFRGDLERLGWLSFVICATRVDGEGA